MAGPAVAMLLQNSSSFSKNYGLSPNFANHAPRLVISRTPCHLASARQSQRATPPTTAAAAGAEPPQTTGRSSRLKAFRFAGPNGRWRVRPMNKNDPEEVRAVVRLQTEGFHVENAIPILDAAFKAMFAAEVLSEMQRKVKYNPDDKFISLVVEGVGRESISGVAGVVEVSYTNDKEVLGSLEPGTTSYVYIASMAVDPGQRRQGAASALLAAAERVAKVWDAEYTVLHVYQDNTSAVELYKQRGYEIIFQDAAWKALLAMRPRFLMRRDF